jgi:hypothetical protein
VAYVDGTPSSQGEQTFRVKNSASSNVTISANSSGSTKYDWLYIKLDATTLNNPNSAGDNVATLVTSRSSSSSADDGTPPTYGYCIAVITVANGATSITNGNIRDERVRSGLTPEPTSVSSASWTDLGAVPSSVTDNGNRSYDLIFTGLDITDTVWVGQRLKLTRTVTAPTKCADLESSSSQYFSKSSPAGMTFTDDFVVSAWVKLESYTASGIVSRYNGTSGWIFELVSTGQVRLTGFNGGAGNASYVQSYQSLPLNKWVHISAQLDMSAFTATTTTSYVMFDGVDVPASVTRAGTNPTTLIQAGDLNVGAFTGANYFDGKIAQVAIYSAKVTQATIKASRHQTLTGSETSLVSAYSLNNSILDLNTSNANNLTAQGSALATSSDSPFAGGADIPTGVTAGTTGYGIITKASFSSNTTLTVQVPEGYAIPTSGGVSAVSYSTQKTPYGFPAQRGIWVVRSVYKVSETISVAGLNIWYSSNAKLTVPAGSWVLGYEGPVNFSSTVNGIRSGTTTLADSAPTNNIRYQELTVAIYQEASNSNALITVAKFIHDYTVSTATVNSLYGQVAIATGTETWQVRGESSAFIIYAECAYL